MLFFLSFHEEFLYILEMNGPDVQQNNNNNLLCGCCDDALLQPVSLFLEVFPGLMVSEQVLLNLERENGAASF